MNLQELKELKKVALVGASENPEKYGHIILRFLQKKTDYQLYPVNPKSDGEILEVPVYPTLAELPEQVDMVVSVVPPKVTNQMLQQAIDLQIPRFWCQPGASTVEVEEIADGKIELVREKCIMVELG